MPAWFDKLKAKARQLNRETYTLYLAYRHPATPWYAKAFAAVVVAYAFSPIDLIPDFVPILGYLDDLILVPVGITLALKMIPEEALDAARKQAELESQGGKPKNWLAGAVVILIWLILALLMIIWSIGWVKKLVGNQSQAAVRKFKSR